MNKRRVGLMAVGGVIVGILTLRTVRRRRANDANDSDDEEQTGREHANAALSHGRAAGANAVKYTRAKVSERRAEPQSA